MRESNWCRRSVVAAGRKARGRSAHLFVLLRERGPPVTSRGEKRLTTRKRVFAFASSRGTAGTLACLHIHLSVSFFPLYSLPRLIVCLFARSAFCTCCCVFLGDEGHPRVVSKKGKRRCCAWPVLRCFVSCQLAAGAQPCRVAYCVHSGSCLSWEDTTQTRSFAASFKVDSHDAPFTSGPGVT